MGTFVTVGAIFSFNRAGWSVSVVAEGDRNDFLRVLRMWHFRGNATCAKPAKEMRAEALPLPVRDYCSHSCKSGEGSPCVYRNSAQMTGSVLETRQSRLLNALSKVLDEPVASRPAGHLEARSNVGLEVPSRQDDEFFGFPGHVEGREGLVCNRQVIPRCNDHEQRSRADPLN